MKKTIIGAMIMASLVFVIYLIAIFFNNKEILTDETCFTVDNLKIVDYNVGCGSVVNIPFIINNKEIKEIDVRAFYNKELTEVKISEGYEIIGISAFEGNNIINLELPNTIKEIKYNAFYNNQIKELNLPDTILKIGEKAFNRNNLEQPFIYMPTDSGFDESIVIGYGGNLKDITLPSNIVTIYNEAFADVGLENVVLNKGLFVIKEGAFNNNNLKIINFPNTVSYVENDVFKNNSLVEITVDGKEGVHHFNQFDENLLSITKFNGIN